MKITKPAPKYTWEMFINVNIANSIPMGGYFSLNIPDLT